MEKVQKRRLVTAFILFILFAVFTQSDSKFVKHYVFNGQRLVTSCKEDYALNRVKYSVMSREPSTNQILVYVTDNLPKDKSWVAQISTSEGFFYSGHFPWKLAGKQVVYESFIWKCRTEDDALYHVQYFQAVAESEGTQLDSYKIEQTTLK